MILHSSKEFDSVKSLAGKCAKFTVFIRLIWFLYGSLQQNMWMVFHGERDDSRRTGNCKSAMQYGGGKIILLGFRVRLRGQPHGTFRLLFNAILGSSTVGATES
ncbi:MAG: hypothetical protein A2Z38_06005 [Planctomycetes bacterium RBG_19FT_COMBO_48_8]|nr:MAG: hypothetical protein A2Z38_06005 [Planctomycetes bacterium RBG_19FT_COMBO_48_8]